MKSIFNREKGTVLVIVLFFLVLVGGVLGGLSMVANTSISQTEYSRQWLDGFYRAEAALQEARYHVFTDSYSSGVNDWLRNPTMDHSSELGANVDVQNLGLAWFKITATAQIDMNDPNSDHRELVWYIREKDYFTKYMMFTNSESGHWGNAKVHGDIHNNQSLYFHSSDATFYGFVSARNFYFYSGGYSMFEGGYDDDADQISFPTHQDLQAIGSGADIRPVGDCTIEFITDQANNYVTIARITDATGTTDYVIPANQDRVIYVDGDVDSIKGHINGRVSVAATGGVDITESLVYVDGNGEPAYQNIMEGGGSPTWECPACGKVYGSNQICMAIVGTRNCGGEVYKYKRWGSKKYKCRKCGKRYWNNNGGICTAQTNEYCNTQTVEQPPPGPGAFDYRTADYYTNPDYWEDERYEPNSAYTGNSALGIMCAGEIRYGQGAPSNTNIEMNCACLSVNNNFHSDLNRNKYHMRIVGSIVSHRRGWRYSGSSGYPRSGMYVYDNNLMNNPPPSFLEVNTPLDGGWLVVK